MFTEMFRLFCIQCSFTIQVSIFKSLKNTLASAIIFIDTVKLSGHSNRSRETGVSPPVKYFNDFSKAALLLWIFFFCVVFLCLCARLLVVPCDHLGKG